VNQIFRDLGMMIHEQGEVIGEILVCALFCVINDFVYDSYCFCLLDTSQHTLCAFAYVTFAYTWVALQNTLLIIVVMIWWFLI